jgi:hybrid cluster-associated redox disulfide protein
MVDFPRPAQALKLTVGDLLTRWPAGARAFVEHRMACIGCAFSAFDTLEEALDMHHVPAASFFRSLEGAASVLSQIHGEET